MKPTARLLALAVGCLLILAALLLPYRIGVWLLFGWITFPVRVLPGVSVDWPAIAVSAVAVLLFTAGVHWLGRTWRRTSGEAGTVFRPWKWRCSLTVVAGVFLLFLAGTAMVAVTHQIVWLVTSKEPLTGITLRREGRRSNLREIGMAIQNYASTYDSKLPSGGTFAADGTMLHSWETQLLPYIGYTDRDIDQNLPWNHPKNKRAFRRVLPQFINDDFTGADLQDEQGYGLSHYAANSRFMGANRKTRLEDIGSLASTPLVGEVNANFRPWGHPVNFRDPAHGINRSPHGFGGRRASAGANFLMADGSVRFVSERISLDVLQAPSTPGGR